MVRALRRAWQRLRERDDGPRCPNCDESNPVRMTETTTQGDVYACTRCLTEWPAR
jgi:predicted RNA-binding Zn-ribbon protein involved in translation (DUF1610 family)